jgi:hypothetical protein
MTDADKLIGMPLARAHGSALTTPVRAFPEVGR